MIRPLHLAGILACLWLTGCIPTETTRPDDTAGALRSPAGRANIARMREQSQQYQQINQQLLAARQAQKSGQFAEARQQISAVLAIEADNSAALEALSRLERAERHQQQLDQVTEQLQQKSYDSARQALREVLIEDPANQRAQTLQRQLQREAMPAQTQPRKLKPRDNATVTLEFRDANLRSIFEVLSKTSGINFVMDPNIRPDLTASIFVKDAAVEEVIDYLLLMHQLQRKVLSDNALMIFPAAKAEQYEELVLRSYFLNYADARQTAALLKSVLPIKELHVDEKLNMLSVKATYEQLRDIDKLVTDSDLPDPEVVLDVEVLEVRASRLSDIGVIFPDTLSVLPAGDDLTVQDVRSVNSASIGLSPALALSLLRQDGESNLLANPRIRVKSREKAKIHIGDKIPIPVTTVGGGNSNFIGQSANYVDVGLKLDVEPRVMVGNEVSIRVSLEVSNATFTAGSIFPTIGTRNTSTVMMTGDGQTQILAGLINDEDRRNTRRLPGLGDLPILGRLFSEPNISKAKTEIVLLITPHVVRNLRRPDADNAEFYLSAGSQRSANGNAAAPAAGANATRLVPAVIAPAAASSANEGYPPATTQTPAPQQDQPAPGLRAPLGRPVGDD